MPETPDRSPYARPPLETVGAARNADAVRSPRPPRRRGDAATSGELAVWPGRPFPLGATWDGIGTNFSVFSEVGDRVELCLFSNAGSETRVELHEQTAFIHHAYVPG